ncbi:MAG: glycosyltransferase family 39 protein [Bryobacteraceae bacterium]|nr:glycosyltransferase family 39 protein [Bryobacteraceae bacterium]MDW8379676.1 glycosyltransferase family 39 protein [Bryobacterales bacterium]
MAEVLLLAMLVAGYLGVILDLAAKTGVTVDEPSHIVSSILYWEGNDSLYPGDLPPLIKITGGALAASADFRIVEESHPVWSKRHEWPVGLDMIRRMTERQIRESMFRARLGVVIFPLATVVLLWWWARQLFPPAIALALAACFALEPTALGHAALFKNDHAATFGYLVSWYCAWRFWRQPTLIHLLWVAVATTLAWLGKLSMLFLSPLPLLLAVLRLRGRSLLGGLLLVALIPYALSAVAFGFQLQAIPENELQALAERRFLPGLFANLFMALDWFPIPIRLWHGISGILFNLGQESAVYLLGQRHPWGHWSYFLVATLVKSPEPLLLAVGLGSIWIIREAWQRKLTFSDLLWIMPAPWYFVLASSSNLQLGFRLILPCLPFALFMVGRWLARLPAWSPAMLVLSMFCAVAPQYPHLLSYFNVASGGPKNALRYLSDSNVDWGQDLRELRRWVQQAQVPQFFLSYFGSDNVYAYFREDQVKWIEPPYGGFRPQTAKLEPGPGIYAISATLLTGQFADPAYRDYYAAFRQKQPIGYAGHSLYIYQIP